MAPGAVVSAQGASRASEYRGTVTVSVALACIVGACTGLVFGYDIGVAGGVASFPQFQQLFFPDVASNTETNTDPYCKHNDVGLSLFVSCLFLTGMVGAFIGSFTNNRFGRRFTMVAGGLCFILGSVLQAVSPALWLLIIGRLILGLGVGFCVQTGPLYMSELAPYHLRGMFNTLFQLFITFGILAAQLVNYGTQFVDNGWRISLGLAGVPALILTLGCFCVPESPNFLLAKGEEGQAREVLAKIRGTKDIGAEMEDLVESANHARTLGTGLSQWRCLFSPLYRPQLVTIIAMASFNQLDGINTIMFYAPQLFDTMGSGQTWGLVVHCIIGAVNVVTTFVAVFTVDSLGRKFWLVEASFQMMVCEIIMGAVIGTQMGADGSFPQAAAYGLIAVVCVFIAGHAWGWGPMAWLVISEVSPQEVRAAGTALGTSVNFLLSFCIGQAFLPMLCAMQFGVFFFFAGWLLIMGVYCIFLLPETKGVPIEEIQEGIFMPHWYWGKVLAKARANRRNSTAEGEGKEAVTVTVFDPTPDAAAAAAHKRDV